MNTNRSSHDLSALSFALALILIIVLMAAIKAQCQVEIVPGGEGRIIPLPPRRDSYHPPPRSNYRVRRKKRKPRLCPPATRPRWAHGNPYMDRDIYDWSRHTP